MGELVVTVLRANRLRSKDYLGASDPYVALKLADLSLKTNVIKNTLNPEWNETFSLVVNDPEKDSLEIFVYDWDKGSADDDLGVQVVSLKQLSRNTRQTFTLNLLKNHNQKDEKNNKDRGEIILELEYKQSDRNKEDNDVPREVVVLDVNTLDHSPEDAENAEIFKQDNSLADETILSTQSAEGNLAIENTPNVQVNTDDATDGRTVVPECDAIIPVEPTEDPAEGEVDLAKADGFINEENIEGGYTLSTGSDAVHTRGDRPSTFINGFAKGKTTDEEAQSAETGEGNAVEDTIPEAVGEDFKGVEPGPGNEELKVVEEGCEEKPLTDSVKVVPPVVGKSDEASPSAEELANGETTNKVDQSPEHGEAIIAEDVKDAGPYPEAVIEEGVQEEILPSSFAEGIPLVESTAVEDQTYHEGPTPGDTSDEILQTPDGAEATVEDVNDVDPAIKYEDVNEESIPEEALSSAEDISLVEGIDDLSTPSHEEGVATAELAQSPKPTEAIAVEDLTDGKRADGDQWINKEANQVEEMLLIDSADSIPLAGSQGKDVEAPAFPEEFAEGDTIDEATQFPETTEAVPQEDVVDTEPGAGDEDEDEKITEEALSTDSAASIPVAKADGKDVEAPASRDELAEEDAIDEVAQLPETSEAIAHEDVEGWEPAAGDEWVNETVAEKSVPTDSVDSVPLAELEDIDVEARASQKELREEDAIVEVAEPPETSEAVPVEDVEDREPGTAERVHEEENVAEKIFPTDSSDSISLSELEGKDVEAPTSKEELPEEDTIDKVAQYPESSEAVSVGVVEDRETVGVSGVNAKESVAHNVLSTDSTDSIPLVQNIDVEDLTSHEELADEDTIDEATRSAETSEAVDDRELGGGDEGVNKEEVAEEALPPDAVPLVEGIDVEDSTFHEKLADEDTIDEATQRPQTSEAVPLGHVEGWEPAAGDEGVNEEENVAEKTVPTDSADPIPLAEAEGEDVDAPASQEDLPEEDAIDKVAQQTETSEAFHVEDVDDREPAAGDEGVNEEETVAEESVPTDSADSVSLAEIERKDMEAPASQEELPEEGAIVEVAQISGSSEAVPVEVFEEREHAAGDEGVNEEESVGEKTFSTDSTDSVPSVEVIDVEDPTSHEELADEDTIDEATRSPEPSEAVTVDDGDNRELGAGDEGVKEERTVAEESVPTDFADSIPLAELEGKAMEALASEEVPEEDTIVEVAQPPETSEAVPVEAVEDREPAAGDEGVSEAVAEMTLSTDSVPLVEGIDVEDPTTHEDLAEEDIIDEAIQSPETSEADPVDYVKDMEPEAGDEGVNEEENTAGKDLPLVGGINVKSPSFHDEITEEDTVDEVAKSPDIGEAIAGEYFSDGEPDAIDVGVDEEENVAKELVLTDSAHSVPLGGGRDLEPPTSQEEEFAEGSTIDDVAQCPESSEAVAVEDVKVRNEGENEEITKIEEATIHTNCTDLVSLDEGKNVDAPISQEPEEFSEGSAIDDVDHSPESYEVSGDEGENEEETITEEILPTVPADSVPQGERKNVEASTSQEEDEELVEGGTNDDTARSAVIGEGVAVEDVKAGDEADNEAEIISEEILQTDSAGAVPADEGKNVEVSTLQEEEVLPEWGTIEDVAQSAETGEVVDVEDVKAGDEGENAEEIIKEEEDEGKNVEASSQEEEELSERRTINDVGQSPESGEVVDVEDVKAGDEGENAAEIIKEEVLPTHSADSVSLDEGKVVEHPTSHEKEDLPEGGTIDGVVESPEEAVAVKDLKAGDEGENEEEILAEEILPTDSTDSVPLDEGKDAEFPTSQDQEELSERATINDVAQSPESSEAVALEDVKAGDKGENEEGTITEEILRHSAEATPLARDKNDEAPAEEITSENEVSQGLESWAASSVEGTKDEGPVVQDAKVGELFTNDEGVNTREHVADEVPSPKYLTNSFSHAKESVNGNLRDCFSDSPIVIDTDTNVQLPASFVEFSKDSNQSEDGPTLQDELYESLARKEIGINSQDSGVTAPSDDRKQDESASSQESPKAISAKSFKTVNHNESRQLEEWASVQESNEVTSGKNAEAINDDDRELVIDEKESTNIRSAADGSVADAPTIHEKLAKEETIDGTTRSEESSEAPLLDSAKENHSSQELVKVHIVAEDSEDDKSSVPLSTHTADLSFSWVGSCRTSDQEAQSASAISRSNQSQTSQPVRPDDDFASGRDGWRVVSNEDISALGVPKSKIQEVDPGPSGAKFPLSIILWCSQSLSSLFSGHHL